MAKPRSPRSDPPPASDETSVVVGPRPKRKKSFKTSSWGTIGRVALCDGTSAAHASALERKWLLFIDSEPAATNVRYEPFTIYYRTAAGRRTHYTPDITATFVRPGVPSQTIIYEVKEAAELAKKAEEFRERFATCEQHCRAQGWEFRVVTELDLPHPRLENVLKLRRYRMDEHDEPGLLPLIDSVRDAKKTTIGTVITASGISREQRAITRAAIWHLVATARLWVDLDQALTDSAELRVEAP